MISIAKIVDGELVQGGVEIHASVSDPTPIWIDINNESEDTIHQILTQYDCHPLAISDAKRLRHQPKVEFFDDHFFVVLRGVSNFDIELHFTFIKVSYFVGDNFLITVRNGDSLSIKQWHESPLLPATLSRGGYHLFFSLCKSMGSNYTNLMLDFEANLNQYEDLADEALDDDWLRDLINYKTRLRKLLRIQNYHERIFSELLSWSRNSEVSSGSDELSHLAQDSYDKFERLKSLSLLHYDITGDLIEGHYSLSAHKLNDTMRILTVLTAIFVPLSFLAGLYGMNFVNIPELQNPNGYFILVGVMVAITTILLFFFKKNRWL